MLVLSTVLVDLPAHFPPTAVTRSLTTVRAKLYVLKSGRVDHSSLAELYECTCPLFCSLKYAIPLNTVAEPLPVILHGALLQPQIISAKRKILAQAGNHTIWSTIADLPVEGSTCLTLNGQLLAVGGCEPDSKMSTNNIILFNTAKKSWDVVGHIPTPRYQCLLTVLSYDQLIVVDTETDNIEIATVCMW